MVCYTDESLGPCRICKEITDLFYVEEIDGQRWITGYECTKCKDNKLKCKPCKGKGRGGHQGCEWICPDCNGTGVHLIGTYGSA